MSLLLATLSAPAGNTIVGNCVGSPAASAAGLNGRVVVVGSSSASPATSSAQCSQSSNVTIAGNATASPATSASTFSTSAPNDSGGILGMFFGGKKNPQKRRTTLQSSSVASPATSNGSVFARGSLSANSIAASATCRSVVKPGLPPVRVSLRATASPAKCLARARQETLLPPIPLQRPPEYQYRIQPTVVVPPIITSHTLPMEWNDDLIALLVALDEI